MVGWQWNDFSAKWFETNHNSAQFSLDRMRLHVHCSLGLGEYDVARQVISRGRLTRPKLLTSLIEDIQRFGIRAVRPSYDQIDSAIPSLNIEKRKRQIILALRTARRRLPELGEGCMFVSLNWWLDETVAKAIYTHSAWEAFCRDDLLELDSSALTEFFSDLLIERGVAFYTKEPSWNGFSEEDACFLKEQWDILWSEVRERADAEHCHVPQPGDIEF